MMRLRWTCDRDRPDGATCARRSTRGAFRAPDRHAAPQRGGHDSCQATRRPPRRARPRPRRRTRRPAARGTDRADRRRQEHSLQHDRGLAGERDRRPAPDDPRSSRPRPSWRSRHGADRGLREGPTRSPALRRGPEHRARARPRRRARHRLRRTRESRARRQVGRGRRSVPVRHDCDPVRRPRAVGSARAGPRAGPAAPGDREPDAGRCHGSGRRTRRCKAAPVRGRSRERPDTDRGRAGAGDHRRARRRAGRERRPPRADGHRSGAG